MKRKSRIALCLLTAALLLVGLALQGFAGTEASGSCGRYLKWSLSDDGRFAVTGSGAMTNYYLTDYHWSAKEYKIRSVTIAEGCTSVGYFAFQYCNNMRALTLPVTVKTVGYGAFMNCTALEALDLPDGVTGCGQNSFQNCMSLRTAYLGQSLKSIAYATFSGCARLEKIYLPKTLSSISAFAFLACDRLTDVYFGGTQEQWDAISVNARGNDTLQSAALHLNAARADFDPSSQTETTAQPATAPADQTTVTTAPADQPVVTTAPAETPAETTAPAEPPAETTIPTEPQSVEILLAAGPMTMSGDVNADGRVTAADARLALRISAKLDATGDLLAADLSGDGRVTASEARQILRMSAGLV